MNLRHPVEVQAQRQTPLEQRSDSTWLFGAFALLFAISLILHQLWWGGFEVRSPHFVVILAAFWTILRPTSVVRFLMMLATEVVAVTLDMPDVGSHTLLALVSGGCMLMWTAWTTLRTHRLPEGGVLFERVAPFLAVQLLLVYLVAAVAKMNTGFFDPGISCAAPIAGRLPWSNLPLLSGSWSVVASIWGTVIIEVTLPILLAVRRTRLVGLVLGGVFHAVLGLAGNVPFSAFALALLVAFLPSDTPTRLRALAATHPGLSRWAGGARSMSRSRAAFPVAVGAWLAGAAILTNERGPQSTLLSHGMGLFTLAAFAGGIVLVLGLARGGVPGDSFRSLRIRHQVFVAGIALLVLNSVSPYVGLKTDSSLTMFSNLRTEADQWNHLFIPEDVRIFPYLDHPVRIVSSDDPALEAMRSGDARFVPYELERYLRSHPDTTVTYAKGDAGAETLVTARPGTDRAPLTTRLLDKIAKFQPVPPTEGGRC